METATTAKLTCQGERDEVRHDVMSGDFYDTGFVLSCMKPLVTEEDLDHGYCAGCRGEHE